MYAKKNNGKKIAVLVLSVVLLVVCSIGATLAWLTAESGTVTNTFTTGDITIELWEHDLDDGKLTDTEITENKTDYKVTPGATQPKDPFVRVKANSEKCWVYVCVTNNLVIENKTVATLNIDSSKWTTVDTSGNKTVYRYYQVVDASAGDVELPVFTTVTYSGTDITKGNIEELKGKTIVIDAYAHQSENLTSDIDVDALAKAHFGISATNA